MRKTFFKTLTYGIMHVIVATLVAYALSGSWVIAISIGLIEPAVQTVMFFFHEGIWEKKITRQTIRSYFLGK